MTDRECASCGARVAKDRLTDTACWGRVPMDLKHQWWNARKAGVGARIRAAGPILTWLRDNPPPVKKAKRARKS